MLDTKLMLKSWTFFIFPNFVQNIPIQTKIFQIKNFQDTYISHIDVSDGC